MIKKKVTFNVFDKEIDFTIELEDKFGLADDESFLEYLSEGFAFSCKLDGRGSGISNNFNNGALSIDTINDIEDGSTYIIYSETTEDIILQTSEPDKEKAKKELIKELLKRDKGGLSNMELYFIGIYDEIFTLIDVSVNVSINIDI